jgi:hypothetical protein
LRRAALLVVMLFVMVFVLGWLFYAGIAPGRGFCGSHDLERATSVPRLTRHPNPLPESFAGADSC